MKESSDSIHMRLLEVRTVHWIQCKDQHHLPAYPTTSQLPRLPGYPGLPYSIPAITSNTWAIPEPSLVYTTTYKDTITSWIVLERKEERNPRSKVTKPLPSKEEVDTERVGVYPRRSGLGHRGEMGETNKCQDRYTCKLENE